MFATRRTSIISAAGLVLAGALATLPAASGSAAQAGEAPALAYDVNFDAADQASAPLTPAHSTPAVANASPLPSAASVDSDELECMAKVVHHESRGQPRR